MSISTFRHASLAEILLVLNTEKSSINITKAKICAAKLSCFDCDRFLYGKSWPILNFLLSLHVST